MVRLLPSGESGLLLECADLAEVRAYDAALRADPLPGVLDVVPAARTVLLVIDPGATTPERIAEALRGTAPPPAEPATTAPLEIPVRYDGPDLAGVADLLGWSVEEVVSRHTATTWTVAFGGFAPGFGYLVAADGADWRVPRHDSPRTRVPAGSVGLAGTFTGVYPRESPGGWRLIGRTTLTLFDLHRDPPALLAPQTVVRFVAADAP